MYIHFTVVRLHKFRNLGLFPTTCEVSVDGCLCCQGDDRDFRTSSPEHRFA